MVSAVRSWNAWNLHSLVLLSLIFLPGGFMVALHSAPRQSSPSCSSPACFPWQRACPSPRPPG
jgi:hypothetical protein